MKNSANLLHRRALILQAILVASIVCLGACNRTSEALKRPNVTPLSPRLQSMFEKTKTVCFGRFVIEIPSSATVVFGVAEVGPEISYLPGEGSQIARRLSRDLAETEISREYFTKNGMDRLPLFGTVIDGIVLGQKITFDSKDQVGYYINSYVPIGEDLFVQHISSVMHQDYDAALFNNIASKLRLRREDEVPTEPGTCIAGGFLPMALEYERVTFGVRLKEFSDVHLSIEVHKNRDRLEESASLERRLNEGEALAKAEGHGSAYARIVTFRRGLRQLGQWHGFEIAARKPAYNDDSEAHEFLFHSLGALHDPLQPQIEVRLDTGVKNNRTARIKPSLTDEEAIALWDKLMGTIRVRETSVVKPSNAVSAKVSLGKLTATGDICMQQGWWQCVEGENIEGGRRRHFKVGESMPQAVLVGEPNFFQKLTGERPRHARPTVWKLVEYDAEPAAQLAPIEESSLLAALVPALPESATKSEAPPGASEIGGAG
jgi:hypothetical protein